jgi:SEC-C motif-containing protein
MQSCPCGSGNVLAGCCGIYHANPGTAPTAEALMRSRYSAYVVRNSDYLLLTWAKAQRPRKLDLAGDQTEWLGLHIERTEAGRETDDTGRVAFVARFRSQGVSQALHEDSQFVRENGSWVYVDGTSELRRTKAGTVKHAAQTPSRNDPCTCGSGLKWKKCCGRS